MRVAAGLQHFSSFSLFRARSQRMCTLRACGLGMFQGCAKTWKASKRLRWMIAGAAGVWFTAAPARAAFTPVSNPFVGEPDQKAILENEYGVGLTKIGVDYIGT